jgi:release factor glutamine methyltransferase
MATEPCQNGMLFPFVWSLDRTSNVGRALLAASRRLRESGSETPQLDSALLLAHVLGVSKTWLYAHPNRRLAEQEIARFEELVRQRMCHQPVAYLVGYRSFYGIDITVDPRVLIPRPETELLVERVMLQARNLVEGGATPRVADVGTGSGAIAVALAVNVPQVVVYAVDVSDDALAVAAQNVWRYGVGEQVQLLPGNLLDPLPEPVDIVIANLPYVASSDLPTLPRQVREFEPRVALDGGPTGREVIETFLRTLAVESVRAAKLCPGARIYLEIGAGQSEAVYALAQQLLPAAHVDVLSDYAGHDRIVIISM